MSRQAQPLVADRNTMVALGDAFIQSITLDDREPAKVRGRVQTTVSFAAHEMERRLAMAGMSHDGVSAILAKATAAADRLVSACESPIEREMCGALVMANYEGFLTAPPAVHLPKADRRVPQGDVVIIPQFAILKYRLDFAVIAMFDGRQKITALECDGAEYHKDGVRDWNKDQYLRSAGMEVVRATGREIRADPDAVARRVSTLLTAWRMAL